MTLKERFDQILLLKVRPLFIGQGFSSTRSSRTFTRERNGIHQTFQVCSRGNRAGDPHYAFTFDIILQVPETGLLWGNRFGKIAHGRDRWYYVEQEGAEDLADLLEHELRCIALPFLNRAASPEDLPRLLSLLQQGDQTLPGRLRQTWPEIGRPFDGEWNTLMQEQILPLLAREGFEAPQGALRRILAPELVQYLLFLPRGTSPPRLRPAEHDREGFVLLRPWTEGMENTTSPLTVRPGDRLLDFPQIKGRTRGSTAATNSPT